MKISESISISVSPEKIWDFWLWEDGRYFEFLNASFTGPGIMRIILPLMKGYLRKGMKGDLLKLKEIMEKLI